MPMAGSSTIEVGADFSADMHHDTGLDDLTPRLRGLSLLDYANS